MDRPHKGYIRQEDKQGVPLRKEVYDSGNEPLNEEKLKAYQTRFGIRDDAQGEVGQSSTVPPPPPPLYYEEPPPSPTPALEDQVHELTTIFDAFWDETQDHLSPSARTWMCFGQIWLWLCTTRRFSYAIRRTSSSS